MVKDLKFIEIKTSVLSAQRLLASKIFDSYMVCIIICGSDNTYIVGIYDHSESLVNSRDTATPGTFTEK